MISLYNNKKTYYIDLDKGELVGTYPIHKDSVVYLIRGDYDSRFPSLKGKDRLVIDEVSYIISIKALLKVIDGKNR